MTEGLGKVPLTRHGVGPVGWSSAVIQSLFIYYFVFLSTTKEGPRRAGAFQTMLDDGGGTGGFEEGTPLGVQTSSRNKLLNETQQKLEKNTENRSCSFTGWTNYDNFHKVPIMFDADDTF